MRLTILNSKHYHGITLYIVPTIIYNRYTIDKHNVLNIDICILNYCFQWIIKE